MLINAFSKLQMHRNKFCKLDIFTSQLIKRYLCKYISTQNFDSNIIQDTFLMHWLLVTKLNSNTLIFCLVLVKIVHVVYVVS